MLTPFPQGGYQFLPSIEPFSRGVVALPGFEIVRVRLQNPVPEQAGLERIQTYLEGLGRPVAALCALELRIAQPVSFEEFVTFNYNYRRVVSRLGIDADGHIPMARTNVAPGINPPNETLVYGFSYTVPSGTNGQPDRSFIVTGTAELKERSMMPTSVVRYGETTPDALAAKAQQVVSNLERRLAKLNTTWSDSVNLSVYTVHGIQPFLAAQILESAGAASIHGVHWYYSRPPIVGLEFEMDMQSVRRSLWLD